MKGGARVVSGPPPDPMALSRQRDAGEWTVLEPGRRGEPPPPWPLDGLTEREEYFWRGLWEKPQGAMWMHQDQVYEVALLTRNLAEVEQPGSPVNLGTLVRQQMDSLGLTTPGLRQNRWRFGRPDQAVAKTAPKRTPISAVSARARFAVIDGDAAG